MNAPASELVQRWTPKLRKIAYQTGADFDDVAQEAWLLAATMRAGDDLVPRWLVAVERHARAQASRGGWASSNVEHAGGDDPAAILQAVEDVAGMLAGQRLCDMINMPVTTREVVAATGKSARQARRDLKKIKESEKVQRGLFDFEAVVGVGV